MNEMTPQERQLQWNKDALVKLFEANNATTVEEMKKWFHAYLKTKNIQTSDPEYSLMKVALDQIISETEN